jgi:hypothetical protein
MNTLIKDLSDQELIERECAAYVEGKEELANLYAEVLALRAALETESEDENY